MSCVVQVLENGAVIKFFLKQLMFGPVFKLIITHIRYVTVFNDIIIYFFPRERTVFTVNWVLHVICRETHLLLCVCGKGEAHLVKKFTRHVQGPKCFKCCNVDALSTW